MFENKSQEEPSVRLAVVGSTKFTINGALYYARSIIQHYFHELNPGMVISGGAKGIDTLAASIAQMCEIETLEYLPKNPRWEPFGYKDRNELIAQNCTHLLRIVTHDSSTYGSGWTADRARKLGKVVLPTFVL